MSAESIILEPTVIEDALSRWMPNAADRRFGPNFRLDRWTRSIEGLRRAVAEKSVYNVELEGIKSGLNSGVETALDIILEAHLDRWRGRYDKMDYTYRDSVWEDVSTYCQFNQAAGRVRRLEKRSQALADLPEILPYIVALKEIDAIWQAVQFLKPFVIKGRKPLENSKPVDLTNTGTCAVCMNRQKLTAAKHMVHHGFHISDGYGHYFGFRSGRCFGCNYQPYELSNAGNVAYKKALEETLVRVTASLADHREGRVIELTEKRFVREDGRHVEKLFTVKQSEDGFDRLLNSEIRKLEWTIDSLNFDIERQTLLISTWTLKPLPGDVPVTV